MRTQRGNRALRPVSTPLLRLTPSNGRTQPKPWTQPPSMRILLGNQVTPWSSVLLAAKNLRRKSIV
eukprot:6179613-Amphidinium_carterae.1